MAPMDEQDFEQMKAAVAEGTAEGQHIVDEERTGSHRLPTPASKVGKAFWGVVTSLLIMAVGGGVAYVRWAGAKDVTDTSQAQELDRHDKAIIRLDSDKASKSEVKQRFDDQAKLFDEIKSANTDQHKAINTQLEGISKLLWEMKRSGGTR